jgi:outer membrane protein assembly factor BamB
MRTILITSSLLLLIAPALTAQQLHVFDPLGPGHPASFQSGMAVTNGLLLAGSHLHGPKKQGRVEVYDLHSSAHLRFLRPAEFIPKNLFGLAIAASEDWTLISSRLAGPNDWNSGAVYLFDPQTGEELRKYTAPDGLNSQFFGTSLAIEGNLALIGAPADDTRGTHAGAAYLIDIPTGALIHKLLGSDSRQFDNFGNRVALANGRAVVGSNLHDHMAGAVYVFDVATGQEVSKLVGSETHDQAAFGFPVVIHGDRLLVGSSGEDNLDIDRSGAAYLFDLNTGRELHRFASPHPYPWGGFGYKALFGEERILISEPSSQGAISTKGHVFVFDAHTFELMETIQPTDIEEGDHFGRSVASQGCEVVLSSPGASSFAKGYGRAYAFALPSAVGTNTCEANRNSTGDPGVLTVGGSLCVEANHLILNANTLPLGVHGSFLVSQGAAFVPFVGGSQGNLCLAAPIGRYTKPPFATHSTGTATLRINLADLPLDGRSVQPGETWYFQAWYRDSNPGATSNLTQAVSVTFL